MYSRDLFVGVLIVLALTIELISFKLGMMVDASGVYTLILVGVNLTLIQGHRGMRKQNKQQKQETPPPPPQPPYKQTKIFLKGMRQVS